MKATFIALLETAPNVMASPSGDVIRSFEEEGDYGKPTGAVRVESGRRSGIGPARTWWAQSAEVIEVDANGRGVVTTYETPLCTGEGAPRALTFSMLRPITADDVVKNNRQVVSA